MPVVLLEKLDNALKGLVGNLDVLPVELLNLVLQKQPAIQIRHVPHQADTLGARVHSDAVVPISCQLVGFFSMLRLVCSFAAVVN